MLQSDDCFEYSVKVEPPILTIRMHGELDISCADRVTWPPWADLEWVHFVLLDLSSLTFCDTAGLKRIDKFCTDAEAHSLIIRARGVSSIVRKISSVSGIAKPWLS